MLTAVVVGWFMILVGFVFYLGVNQFPEHPTLAWVLIGVASAAMLGGVTVKHKEK